MLEQELQGGVRLLARQVTRGTCTGARQASGSVVLAMQASAWRSGGLGGAGAQR